MFGLTPKCYFCRLRLGHDKVEKWVKTVDGQYRRACPGCYRAMKPEKREKDPNLRWHGRHRKY